MREIKNNLIHLVCLAVVLDRESTIVKIYSAMLEFSSELVEISSDLVRISSELVRISSELVSTISELLIISVFRRNSKSEYRLRASRCNEHRNGL